MPPGDTTIYTSKEELLQSVPDSIRPTIDSLLGSRPILSTQSDGPHLLLPEWILFLIVLMVFSGIIFYQVGLSFFFPKWAEKIRLKKASQLLEQKSYQYAGWLDKYNPYYHTLSKELKERFLVRTVAFLQAKEFQFHSLPYEEHIPVLISGSAVQLTFGLPNFQMDYFPVIHVIGKEYVLQHDQDTYFGHVSKTGIYVAWNHFLKGYAQYDDSINVGLHEMAHAVSYDVFLGQEDRHDRAFKRRLEDFSEEGRPVFRAMRKGSAHLLDEGLPEN